MTSPENYEDEFDNQWLCPYCTKLTEEEERRCPHCGNPLIFKRRVRPDRSVWLWRGFFLQVYILTMIVGISLGYLVFRGRWEGIDNALLFTPIYLGLAVERPLDQVEIIRQIMPPSLFWGLIGIAVFSATVMLLLIFRAPYGNLIYMLAGGSGLIFSVLSFIFIEFGILKVAIGASTLFIGVLQIMIGLNLWDDFSFKERRLHLSIDQDATNNTTLRISARKYADLGLWGNTVIHLRRAILREPGNVESRLELIQAYLKINRPDLARNAFKEVQSMAPDHPQVERIRKRLQS